MIRLERRGDIAHCILARPDARNALSIEHWHALADTVAAAGDARALILSSDLPGSFSAGADLRELRTLIGAPERQRHFREAMRAGIEAVAAAPMPTIAAIDGGCHGAGVALALACDIRVAGDTARFAVPPARLGIGYPREDVARLAAQVGRGRASILLFAADSLDADAARATGLVELRAAHALEAAEALAARIAVNAPEAIRLLKRTLNAPADATLDAAFEARFDSAAFAEGIAAFDARKRP